MEANWRACWVLGSCLSAAGVRGFCSSRGGGGARARFEEDRQVEVADEVGDQAEAKQGKAGSRSRERRDFGPGIGGGQSRALSFH
ncbi:hypothetical protein B0T11DRAFT_55765 [Plectosphaerella cucumerina]|uniref:Secreted protein n=1 Tax=Plectosphaerella cucumerina TaxID=40658 RepID=A0A8K0X6I3_9PEZI|nr:hypothetical protein B0T11DRAFT_55765 [Plectosphaerella cucumerina]